MVRRINSWPQSEYLTFRHSTPNLTEIRCAYELRVLGELNPDQNAKVVGFKVGVSFSKASGHCGCCGVLVVLLLRLVLLN